MLTVAQSSPLTSANTPRPIDLTSPLLTAAAALETELHNAKRREQVLTQRTHWGIAYQSRTIGWLRAVRRSLRRDSHHRTTQLLRRAIVDLSATDNRP